jgi:hypothetical protein
MTIFPPAGREIPRQPTETQYLKSHFHAWFNIIRQTDAFKLMAQSCLSAKTGSFFSYSKTRVYRQITMASLFKKE